MPHDLLRKAIQGTKTESTGKTAMSYDMIVNFRDGHVATKEDLENSGL
jgi:hypothetical protein